MKFERFLQYFTSCIFASLSGRLLCRNLLYPQTVLPCIFHICNMIIARFTEHKLPCSIGDISDEVRQANLCVVAVSDYNRPCYILLMFVFAPQVLVGRRPSVCWADILSEAPILHLFSKETQLNHI